MTAVDDWVNAALKDNPVVRATQLQVAATARDVDHYLARNSYSQTRYHYLTALLTLKQQACRLSAADLGGIDALPVAHLP